MVFSCLKRTANASEDRKIPKRKFMDSNHWFSGAIHSFLGGKFTQKWHLDRPGRAQGMGKSLRWVASACFSSRKKQMLQFTPQLRISWLTLLRSSKHGRGKELPTLTPHSTGALKKDIPQFNGVELLIFLGQFFPKQKHQKGFNKWHPFHRCIVEESPSNIRSESPQPKWIYWNLSSLPSRRNMHSTKSLNQCFFSKGPLKHSWTWNMSWHSLPQQW